MCSPAFVNQSSTLESDCIIHVLKPSLRFVLEKKGLIKIGVILLYLDSYAGHNLVVSYCMNYSVSGCQHCCAIGLLLWKCGVNITTDEMSVAVQGSGVFPFSVVCNITFCCKYGLP